MKHLGFGNEPDHEILVSLTREELLLLMGGLRESLEEIEDWEFSIRLGAEKEEFRTLFRAMREILREPQR